MTSTGTVSTVCAKCGGSITFPAGASQVHCSFCDGGMVVAEGTRLVRLDCPVCAGNFYYIDGLMSGRCPYCKTELLALTRDRVLRFVVLPEAERPHEDAELYLVPFWQLAGLVFGWDLGSRIEVTSATYVNTQTHREGAREAMPVADRRDSGPMKVFRGRVVERWIPDPQAPALGIGSLRLRAAVFPMEPFLADHEKLGRVLPPTLDIETARERLQSAAMNLGHASDGMTRLDCQRADLVAEALSLLYYPFWVHDPKGDIAVWDGVKGNPEPLHDRTKSELGATTAVFDNLSVIELKCGNCGDALLSGNHAVVYPCPHCTTFWVAEKDGLRPFDASYARPLFDLQDGDKLVWLPFWRVQVAVDYAGRQATTVRDGRDVLGVIPLRGNTSGAEPDAPLGYFVPAYGAMRAPKLDAAARDMNRLQPRLEPGDYVAGEIFSCFYSPDDAVKLGYVVWLQVIPGAAWRRLRTLRLHPGQVELWYTPFAERRRELVNLLTGIRYDRSAFRGLGH